jgi:hypothetical protein
VTHNAEKDFFEKGLIKNVGTQPVKAYRIGWLMYPKGSNKPVEREGDTFIIGPGIQPGETYKVPAQGVDPKESIGSHQRIVFYVAEAILEDGTDWRPDLAAVDKKYKP